LIEVRHLKEKAYNGVKGLPLAKALHTRLTASIATAALLGFVAIKALNCAEDFADYNGKQ
jgi:hypothetical protein